MGQKNVHEENKEIDPTLQSLDLQKIGTENKDSSKMIIENANLILSDQSQSKLGYSFDDQKLHILGINNLRFQQVSPTRRGDGNLLQTNLNNYQVHYPRDSFSSRTFLTTENQINDLLSF